MKKIFSKLVILVLGLVCLGGCMNQLNKEGFIEQNQVITSEKHHQLEISIAKLIVSDYEGVETIEFTGWKRSIETGTWGTTVVINGNNSISFSFSNINGLDNISGRSYHPDYFKLVEKFKNGANRVIKERVADIEMVSLDNVKISYSYKKGE